MIKSVLIFNNHGNPRLSKFYNPIVRMNGTTTTHAFDAKKRKLLHLFFLPWLKASYI